MSGFQSWGMDARLVHNTLAGDSKAFTRLVERHMPTVEAVALSCTRNFADAQDVSQEAFLKAYQSLDSLKERGKFGPWIVTIARNAGLRLAQRRSREIPLADIAIAEPTVQPDDASLAELLDMVHRHIAQLPDDSRDVLLLHYYSGKSLREIATLLNISRDAAAKRLQRGRALLGEEVLKSVAGAQRSPEQNRKRAIGIATAIISAGAARNAGAATTGGASATLLAAMLKPTLAASLATAVAFVGFFYYIGTRTQTADGVAPAPAAPIAQAERNAPAVIASSAVARPEPLPQPTFEPERPTTGPGSITATVITAKGEPAPAQPSRSNS